MLELPSQVLTAISVLEAAGYEAYLVGGAVRDYVRGKPAKDWDITTNALPMQVERAFNGYRLIETGLKHGTVTVLLDGEPLEITTYRVDGEYTDHRRPDTVTFTRSIHQDLARRDFTMNALAYNPECGFVDLFDGLKDLENGIIRCVGDADLRFNEDALRILRALRFASVQQMEIEAETADAIRRNKELLKNIALERIREELTKLLTGAAAGEVLRQYADVLAVILPEIVPTFGFEQHNPHHDKDVWLHTIAVLEAIEADPILRWAALLHDIGKPECFSQDQNGIGHFYGHPEQSAVIADSVLRRLRFDNAGREQIVALVKAHDQTIHAQSRCIKRMLSRMGDIGARQLLLLQIADTKGQSVVSQPRLATYTTAQDILEELIQTSACVTLQQLAVNGHDAIELGYRGREVGCALEAALDAVLEEIVPNERQALVQFLSNRRSKDNV